MDAPAGVSGASLSAWNNHTYRARNVASSAVACLVSDPQRA